jgi:ATP-binding cassette subfamily B protein
VSIELRAGQVVALVGENGSGKTTLAKLLGGLYAPTSGTVRWDAVDASTVDPDALRRLVTVVFQDFARYNFTAADNIGLGDVDRLGDRPGIEAAADRAGADRMVRRLPDGYDSVLGREFDTGQDLSTGQWQRIAIARAFFRDAPVVVLDEPTASLDARAEHELFDRIRRLLRGRTVLLVSHRFSTVRSADRIYVLHRGRVTEEGSHDELMAADGTYAELFRLQAAAFLSPEDA